MLDKLLFANHFIFQMNDPWTLNYKIPDRENVRDLKEMFAWAECDKWNYMQVWKTFKNFEVLMCCCLEH